MADSKEARSGFQEPGRASQWGTNLPPSTYVTTGRYQEDENQPFNFDAATADYPRRLAPGGREPPPRYNRNLPRIGFNVSRRAAPNANTSNPQSHVQLERDTQDSKKSSLLTTAFGNTHLKVDQGGTRFRSQSLETPREVTAVNSRSGDLMRKEIEVAITQPKARAIASEETPPDSVSKNLNHKRISLSDWLHFQRLRKADEILNERYSSIKNEIDLEVEIWERGRAVRADLGLKDGESLHDRV